MIRPIPVTTVAAWKIKILKITKLNYSGNWFQRIQSKQIDLLKQTAVVIDVDLFYDKVLLNIRWPVLDDNI